MNWVHTHRRSAAIIGLSLLLPVYLFISVLVSTLGVFSDYRDRAADLRPRIARLQGLLGSEPALQVAAGEVGVRLADLGYAPTQDATGAAASLQADVRQIFAESGLEVSNSQVLATRKHEYFDLIGIKLTAQGELPAVDAALIGLAAFKPQLFVESLDIFPARANVRRGETPRQSVTLVLEVLALRRLQ